MITEQHLFAFHWPDIPRTTTKSEWKAISRWFRVTRKCVEKRIDQAKIFKAMQDCLVYGTGTYELDTSFTDETLPDLREARQSV